jgi:NAD(P)-dependent dehydrogenase (short-subunit alcohol dehydrogenase family)
MSTTVMITGASSGLGQQTARTLAAQGARLWLVARDQARLDAVARDIAAATGNRDVRVLACDLSAQCDVRWVAERFLESGDQLDVLVNNAGAVRGRRREVSVEGIERTFALNHLAYFTLTMMLLPRLCECAPARVVNVAGDSYKSSGRFDFDDYNALRRYRPIRQYEQSKLANVLFTRELARRVDASHVTVNAAGPSRTTATKFAHNVHPLAKMAMRAASPLLLSPEHGAAPIVHLSASPDVAGINGTYWSGLQRSELSPVVNDEDAIRLWDLSSAITGVS